MDKTNERGPQRGFVANSRRGLVAFPKANTASGGSAVSASSAGAEQQRFAHVPVVEEPVLSGNTSFFSFSPLLSLLQTFTQCIM